MSSFSEENIYNQALKNHKEKKIKKAFELYKKVLQINPTHYNSLTNIGNIFFSVKNFKNSRDCFKKLIHENPNDEHALNKLGLIFFELGDYVKALEYFYKLKLINQNYPYLRYNLLCRN